MIDLHVHSTFSDGTLTPELLVKYAVDIKLTAMALTDHDTTAGLGQFIGACREYGLRGVPGVEISANVEKGTLHILGYFVKAGDNDFEAKLGLIRDGRAGRNVQMISNLNELGFALTMEEVASYAGEDVVGRPHFAQAMIAKGYVSDKTEAFDKYLGKGKPGYADRFRMSAEDSISAILGIGAIPVLAHPFTLRLGRSDLREYVGCLASAGLKGIEAYYSEHTNEQIAQYLQLADEFGLLVTGGSDYHGEAVNSRVKLGFGFGRLKVCDELLDLMELSLK